MIMKSLFTPSFVRALVAIASLLSAVHGHGPVDLGLADPYAILAGSAISNAGTDGTIVTGSIGTSPGAAITGFPPGILIGSKDAANGASGAAQGALTTAYNFIATRPFNTTLSNQDLGGMTLLPGVYKFDVDANMNGMLTLDANGSANAVWMFQIGAALLVAKDSSIIFKDSVGNADYVYWQVGSSATIAAGVPMIGNMLALTAISVGNGASVNGRCLARNAAVTLDVNAVTMPPKVPTSTPTAAPSMMPSLTPSITPTLAPSSAPSIQTSAGPTFANQPTVPPSVATTGAPSALPTVSPSVVPSVAPTVAPSNIPSAAPSTVPSEMHTDAPTTLPTVQPSVEPSAAPTFRPTVIATSSPTIGELPIDLGYAEPYAVMAGATVTSTGVVGTVVNGNIGIFPGSALIGFPPAILNGVVQAANGASGGAQGSLTTAYNAVAARQFNTTLSNQDLGGMTLFPGVYRLDGAATMNGALTLDARGDAAAVWMFQIGSSLLVAEGSSVFFKDSIGNPDFVYWQVGSSATVAKGVPMVGNILTLASITVKNGATIKGRCLARNGAVTLDNNVITKPAVIAFSATQTVSGISLEQFNANVTKNTEVMKTAISQTMPGVSPSNIKDFEVTASPSSAAVALFLRGASARALAGSAINLKYKVVLFTTKTSEELQTELKTAVNDGTFNSYMQAAAAEQGATALETATSDTIQTETINPPKADEDSDASRALTGAAIAGIVIGVVLAFLFIFALLAFWWTGGFSAHSSAPVAAPADDTKRSYLAVAAAVPGVAPDDVSEEKDPENVAPEDAIADDALVAPENVASEDEVSTDSALEKSGGATEIEMTNTSVAEEKV